MKTIHRLAKFLPRQNYTLGGIPGGTFDRGQLFPGGHWSRLHAKEPRLDRTLCLSRALSPSSREELLPGVRLGLSMLVRVHFRFKNRAAVSVDRKRSGVDHVVHHVSRVCVMQPVRVVVL